MIVLFIGATVAATWPLSLHLATWAPGSGDPLEVTWIFGWGAHAVRDNPLSLLNGSIFNANIFYPEPLTLAYTENFLGLSMPAAPLVWLTSNPLLVYNLVTIGLYATSGYATYLLVRQITPYRPAGVIAGLAFTLAPYRISQIEHMHVVAIHLMPIMLLLLLRMSRHSSWRIVVAAGVVFGLQIWSSFTGASITLLMVGAWGVWELARHRLGALATLGRAGIAVALGFALAIPVIRPYRDLRAIHPEFKHPKAAVLEFSATPTSYLSPPHRNALVRSPHDPLERRFKDTQGYWEKNHFPGFVLLGAFLIAVGAAFRKFIRRQVERGKRDADAEPPDPDAITAETTPSHSAHLWLFIVIASVGFVTSLGPRLGAAPDGIPLPFSLITKLGFSDLARVPSRFGTLVPFGMAVVVGLAISAMRDPWRHRLAATSLVLLSIELMIPTLQPRRVPAATAVNRTITNTKGAVLALPTVELLPGGGVDVDTIPREAIHLYLSTANFRPMINGYAAFHPSSFWEVVRAVQDFPSAPGMRMLHDRGVTTVIVQTDLVRRTHWADVVTRLDRWPGTLLIASDKDARAYDVSAAADTTPSNSSS